MHIKLKKTIQITNFIGIITARVFQKGHRFIYVFNKTVEYFKKGFSKATFILIFLRSDCHQKPVDSLKIGLGISGAIVLVGVTLIIIWKILSLVYDKVEYSKFETEIKDLIWEVRF